jgi:hypothetical protein
VLNLVKGAKTYHIFFLLLIIFLIFLPSNDHVKASEGWIVPNDGEDSIFAESYVYEDRVVEILFHNKKTSNNYYTTKNYFTITRKPYNREQEMDSTYNSSITKTAQVPRTLVDEISGNEVISTYTITRADFLKAVTDLGITADEIIKNGGSMTVYLQTTFDVYVEGEYRTTVYGCQEMLAAGYKYFGSSGWGSETNKRIRYFYNMPYILTAQNIYDVKIVALDSTTNKEIKDLTPSQTKYTKAVYNQPYTYDILSSNSTISSNGQSYQFKNRWKYSYKKRGATSTTTSGISDVSNKKIDFSKMPDAESMTIYLLYETEVTNYNYKIIAVDKYNKELGTLKDSTGTQSGKTVTYTIASSVTYNKIKYKYQNKWNFAYTDKGGAIKTDSYKSGNINQVMPVAKANSTAIFYVVFDKEDPPTNPPTPPITVTPTPTPAPSIPPVEVPEADYASMPFTTVETSGVLKADIRDAERFTASAGIPTIESLYGQVEATDYLLGYNFEKKVGKKYYSIKVTRNYILQWYSATPGSAGGSKLVTETVPVTQNVTVERAYGYWQINNFDCYKINNAVISNYALPGGSITITPNYRYYNPPFVTISQSLSEKDHIIPPPEVMNGITLPAVVIAAPDSKKTTKPTIPKEDFSYLAKTMTGKIKVKSDYLSFNGATIMNNSVMETEAPDLNLSSIPQCYSLTNRNVLFSSNHVIEATKKNGTYPTFGSLTYTKVANAGSSKADILQYNINGLNNVVIHTPVVCYASITADNDPYVQLINPTKGSIPLVLDPDSRLSDFKVHISNYNFHSGKQGYFTRDFSKTIRNPSLSYISVINNLLKNQVKFPFDVYLDQGIAYKDSDDEFMKAGTWITIDRSSPRFYLPMTVNEGVYTVNFRTIAVNGEPYLNNTEVHTNMQLSNYVATDTIMVEVSGRMYGLKIYDLSDYPMWEEAFRVKNSLDFKKDNTKYTDGTSLESYNSGRYYTYTIGTNDQYGRDTGRSNKYTFPLVNGSHPKYKNVGILKTGYLFRYSLDTIGNMFSDACQISIKPTFYYVDKNGKNRTAIDLYYTESINKKTYSLVKVGSARDKINMKSVGTGDLYLGIPKQELKQTAKLRGMTYSAFTSKYAAMFNFSDIRLNWAFRTYVNSPYLSRVKSYPSFYNVKEKGITERKIQERMQRWYGQYYIPNEVHAVAKGFDVMDYADKYGIDYKEKFWLEEGYIIVNFSIETVGENGKRRLSYMNASNYLENNYCSMWALEGPILSKTSYKGPTFNFYAGDVMIYYSNKKMSDDYNPGAIY